MPLLQEPDGLRRLLPGMAGFCVADELWLSPTVAQLFLGQNCGSMPHDPDNGNTLLFILLDTLVLVLLL